MRQIKPYIGITDFTSYAEVQRMLKVFRKHRPTGSQRLLHVGVMMSYKTLNGIDTKWAKAFPPKERITEIFSSRDDIVYNCLHFADYDYAARFSDVARAIDFAGPLVDAVQLDMPWPNPAMVRDALRAAGRGIEVILQIGKVAMDAAEDDPYDVARRLDEYRGVAHRVLLDRSMGRGLGMNAKLLARYASIIRQRHPRLGLVFAGGLGPDTLHLLGELPGAYPDLSIDAQGRLRSSGNALDPIDWSVAEKYLAKALELLP